MRSASAWHGRAAFALVAAGLFGGCGNPVPPPSATKAPAHDPQVPAEAGRAKPSPPIDLEILYESTPTPGAPTRVVLAVTSEIALTDCSLAVRLPSGIEVTEGSTAWRGALARGRRQVHSFSVRVPGGRRYELTATATADLGGGTRMTRTASLVLNPGAAPETPAGTPKTNSRGEAILELPANPRK